jgi:hypothetical protein
MAFPLERAGVYSREEMDQAEARSVTSVRDVESQQSPRKPSEAQIKRLFAIAHDCAVPAEKVKNYMLHHFNIDSTKNLTLPQYDQLCEALQAGDVEALSMPILEEKKTEPTEPNQLTQNFENFQNPEILAPEEKKEEKPAPQSNELPWNKYLNKEEDPRMVK